MSLRGKGESTLRVSLAHPGSSRLHGLKAAAGCAQSNEGRAPQIARFLAESIRRFTEKSFPNQTGPRCWRNITGSQAFYQDSRLGVVFRAEGELDAGGDFDALEGIAEFLGIGAEFARDTGDEDAAARVGNLQE